MLLENYIQYNIEIRDFIPSNYFVKELNNDQIKIYIIDGIGNSNFLPYSEWFSFIGKKKIIRRINKMILILKRCFPEYSDYFNLETILNEN